MHINLVPRLALFPKQQFDFNFLHSLQHSTVLRLPADPSKRFRLDLACAGTY